MNKSYLTIFGVLTVTLVSIVFSPIRSYLETKISLLVNKFAILIKALCINQFRLQFQPEY